MWGFELSNTSNPFTTTDVGGTIVVIFLRHLQRRGVMENQVMHGYHSAEIDVCAVNTIFDTINTTSMQLFTNVTRIINSYLFCTLLSLHTTKIIYGVRT